MDFLEFLKYTPEEYKVHSREQKIEKIEDKIVALVSKMAILDEKIRLIEELAKEGSHRIPSERDALMRERSSYREKQLPLASQQTILEVRLERLKNERQ